MVELTARQTLFAKGLMRGLPQREAYKLAGYSDRRVKAMDASASRLLTNANFKAYMAELEQAKAISESVTAQTITLMLNSVFRNATSDRQHGAAATAALGIAKLHGLMVDKVEDVTRKPSRNPDAPLEIEVEHWLTDHGLGAAGSAAAPADSANGHGRDHHDHGQSARDARQLDLFSEQPSPDEG